ncbi:F-box only protein 38-like [Haliotis rufescens]|uniref:F-box only protein 38-like n=1 Tax=Haliotis rufescens TaxID=6454 RepID=UPI00201F5D04|nr:F-box only protein 38-like [Haliotis rufescens]
MTSFKMATECTCNSSNLIEKHQKMTLSDLLNCFSEMRQRDEIAAEMEREKSQAFLNSSDFFSHLSLEIICHVLNYLPLRDVLKMEQQCKKIQKAVSMHLKVRKSIDFTEGEIYGWIPASLNDSMLAKLISRCVELASIYGFHSQLILKRRQRGADMLTIPGIVAALSSAPRLKAVEVSDINLMEAILNYLPRLEILGIFKNRNGAFPINPSNKLTLTSNPRITSLHLSGVVISELPRMSHVKHIYLRWVKITHSHPFRDFAVPSLQSFVMSNCAGPASTLKYVPLITGLAAARSLTRLELVRVPFLGGLIQHIVEDSWRVSGFSQLQTVMFGACKHAQEVDLGYLMITAAHCLEELSIQPSLTKDSLFAAIKMADVTFPVFETLHLGYVDPFPESGKWNQEDLVMIHGLAEVSENPAMITDIGMKAIGQCFSFLRNLEIYNCPHLHFPMSWFTSGVEALSHLRHLHLRRCHALRLQDFCRFVEHLPQLELLHLEYMFREPPKGCARVGLSAGTGLGVSSALVQNNGNDAGNLDGGNHNNDDGDLNQDDNNNNPDAGARAANGGDINNNEPPNQNADNIDPHIEPDDDPLDEDDEFDDFSDNGDDLDFDGLSGDEENIDMANHIGDDIRMLAVVANEGAGNKSHEEEEHAEVSKKVSQPKSKQPEKDDSKPGSSKDDLNNPQPSTSRVYCGGMPSGSCMKREVNIVPSVDSRSTCQLVDIDIGNGSDTDTESPADGKIKVKVECNSAIELRPKDETLATEPKFVSSSSLSVAQRELDEACPSTSRASGTMSASSQGIKPSSSTNSSCVQGIKASSRNSSVTGQDVNATTSASSASVQVVKATSSATSASVQVVKATSSATSASVQGNKASTSTTSASVQVVKDKKEKQIPCVKNEQQCSSVPCNSAGRVHVSDRQTAEEKETEEHICSPAKKKKKTCSRNKDEHIDKRSDKSHSNCRDKRECADRGSELVRPAHRDSDKTTEQHCSKDPHVESPIAPLRASPSGTAGSQHGSTCSHLESSQPSTVASSSGTVKSSSANSNVDLIRKKPVSNVPKSVNPRTTSCAVSDPATRRKKCSVPHLTRKDLDKSSPSSQREPTGDTTESSSDEGSVNVNVDNAKIVRKKKQPSDNRKTNSQTSSPEPSTSKNSWDKASVESEPDNRTVDEFLDDIAKDYHNDLSATRIAGDDNMYLFTPEEVEAMGFGKENAGEEDKDEDTKGYNMRPRKRGKSLTGKKKGLVKKRRKLDNVVKTNPNMHDKCCQAVSDEIRETTKRAKEQEEARQGAAAAPPKSKGGNCCGKRTTKMRSQSSVVHEGGSGSRVEVLRLKLGPRRKANMCDKATSTSDPVIEDDHIQVLSLRSKSLLCVTLHMVGVTDIIVDECPNLKLLRGSACRVLKKVTVGGAPKLSKVSFAQCRKIDEMHLVNEVCDQISMTNRVIYLRPMRQFDMFAFENMLFCQPDIDYHLCVIYDYSPDPTHTMYNRARVATWLDLFSGTNMELLRFMDFEQAKNFPVDEDDDEEKKCYRNAYILHGYNDNGSKWTLSTDIPWLDHLSQCPDIDSPDLHPDDYKEGIYCPRRKGHHVMTDCLMDLQDVISEMRHKSVSLYCYSVIVYVNMCDVTGTPTPDMYL